MTTFEHHMQIRRFVEDCRQAVPVVDEWFEHPEPWFTAFADQVGAASRDVAERLANMPLGPNDRKLTATNLEATVWCYALAHHAICRIREYEFCPHRDFGSIIDAGVYVFNAYRLVGCFACVIERVRHMPDPDDGCDVCGEASEAYRTAAIPFGGAVHLVTLGTCCYSLLPYALEGEPS